MYAFSNYAAWLEADVSGCLDALSSVDWARFGAEAEVPPSRSASSSTSLGFRCQFFSSNGILLSMRLHMIATSICWRLCSFLAACPLAPAGLPLQLEMMTSLQASPRLWCI